GNKPLIPESVRLVLKTSDFLENLGGDSASTNTLSYFDSPGAMKAYREQSSIETPEFTKINSSGETNKILPHCYDDSDAAYEQRHKRFERFEKGQRRAEMEKLRHQVYKLGERVGQLKVMNTSAFMSVGSYPPSYLSTYSTIHGVQHGCRFPTPEGEDLRNEMLTTAEAIQQRYQAMIHP
ncbi:hypothetical protein R3P38DRAFT_2471497, partial [Favolaschia claudopus]